MNIHCHRHHQGLSSNYFSQKSTVRTFSESDTTRVLLLHDTPCQVVVRLKQISNKQISEKCEGSPYSITERMVPELIPVLGCHSAGNVSHKPGGRLPLGPQLPSQPLRGCYQFRCLANRGTMGVNSLPKSLARQSHGCNLNPGPTAPESSTLITRLPSQISNRRKVRRYSIISNELKRRSRTNKKRRRK